MIELSDFSKNYKSGFSKNAQKSGFAVHGISLVVQDGSVTGLIGANGSGKTTIIKSICGFHFPSGGKVLVSNYDGQKYNIVENPEKAMELIGYVPEKSLLPQEMYVTEFLEYCAALHNLTPDQKKNALERVIRECDLEEVLCKKIKTLSKGFGQRVSFAQALIHNPPNLILDEPVTGLDPSQIIQMRKLIEKSAQTKAVLLSTHILQEVTSLCTNLFVMNKGKLAASGTEEQIIKQTGTTSLEQAFLKLTQKGAADE
ncbi:MAG: ABC transporter ATP-binding protein [Treponema sp.]|nr:ABC transporter ATP-binding protein [Treponema sp.]